MCKKVNSFLEENGLTGGNKPIGVLEYKDSSHGVQPFCSVFETVGDMRLSTNLF
jgi:hypothetical protein